MRRRVDTRCNVNSYAGGGLARDFKGFRAADCELTLCHKQMLWAWKVSDLMCQCKVQIMKNDSNQ